MFYTSKVRISFEIATFLAKNLGWIMFYSTPVPVSQSNPIQFEKMSVFELKYMLTPVILQNLQQL